MMPVDNVLLWMDNCGPCNEEKERQARAIERGSLKLMNFNRNKALLDSLDIDIAGYPTHVTVVEGKDGTVRICNSENNKCAIIPKDQYKKALD